MSTAVSIKRNSLLIWRTTNIKCELCKLTNVKIPLNFGELIKSTITSYQNQINSLDKRANDFSLSIQYRNDLELFRIEIEAFNEKKIQLRFAKTSNFNTFHVWRECTRVRNWEANNFYADISFMPSFKYFSIDVNSMNETKKLFNRKLSGKVQKKRFGRKLNSTAKI